MKYIYLLTILVLLNTRIYAQDREILVLTEFNCGKEFYIHDKIEIHLNALTSAGYSWYLSGKYPQLDILASSEKNSPLIGAKVTQIFLIDTKLLKQHKDTNKSFNLDFIYKRYWEKDIIKKCQFILKHRN